MAEGNDHQLAAAALRKRLAGERPTAAEAAALKRVEKARHEETCWQVYRAIPQKHWRAMSGRPAKVLQEQAARYGLPFGGATVDLPALAKALHDMLAERGRDLVDGSEDEKTRKTRLEADRLQIKLDLERAGVVPIDEIRAGLAVPMSLLRKVVTKLQQKFGNEAAAMIDAALVEAQAAIDRVLPDDNDADDREE